MEEIYSEGVGMYRDDEREFETTVDPDEFDQQSQMSQDWFSENMTRVIMPKTEVEIPQLESSNIGTIIWYFFTLAWYLVVTSLKNLKGLTGTIINWIVEHVGPQTWTHVQNSFLRDEHIERLRKKWRKIGALPTYSANEGSLNILQELKHDPSLETEGFLRPEDAPVKTIVRLLLDQRNRPHVQCMVEGVPCTFLVDSGAALSVMSYESFLTLPGHDQLIKSYDTPKLYDHQSNEIKIKFCALCRVVFSDKTILIPFLVSGASRSNVIGCNVLMGKSIIFTHRGTDAYLIIGECKAEQRPVMKLPETFPLYIIEDTLVPAESVKTILVTPCAYPMYIDIPDENVELRYISPNEGFEGRTKLIKLNDQGKAKIKVCNRSLVDLALHANTVIATGSFASDYIPLPPKRIRKAKSNIEIKRADDQPTKAHTIQEVHAPENTLLRGTTEENINSAEPEPSKDIAKNIQEIPCFCSLPQENIIIKGNQYGDTAIPYITAGSYTRVKLTSGICENIKIGNKKISIIFGNTKKDLNTCLENCLTGQNVAYITNNDEIETSQDRHFVKIVGGCKEHPFLYQASPTFISFCQTTKGKHLQMLQNLSKRIQFEILNIKVELYYDDQHPKQLHFVLHIPDILTLKENWILNLVGAIVSPYSNSVRILEPYLFPDTTSHRTTMFNNILQRVARLLGITLQGRLPHLEKVFATSETPLKNCTCEYCVSARDKQVYGNLNGGFNKIEQNQDLK